MKRGNYWKKNSKDKVKSKNKINKFSNRILRELTYFI